MDMGFEEEVELTKRRIVAEKQNTVQEKRVKNKEREKEKRKVSLP